MIAPQQLSASANQIVERQKYLNVQNPSLHIGRCCLLEGSEQPDSEPLKN